MDICINRHAMQFRLNFSLWLAVCMLCIHIVPFDFEHCRHFPLFR